MHLRTHERLIALPWLARLRWIAVVGQIGATTAATVWLNLHLPLEWIALVIAITALSNLLVQIWNWLRPPPDWIVPGIILLDVCLLSVLLYFTGGTDNPFSVLYAIHVTMAVVVLGGGWTWFIVALSAIAYAGVSVFHLPLDPPRGLPYLVGRFGQWSALVVVMVLIAYFIGRVMRSLRGQEMELAQARERASRGEHLAALTTLAAGAAHELGTPLGTIALVAKEMELASRRGGDPAALAEDARLIRQEVDRCRSILDRMRVDVIEDARHRPGVSTLGELLAALRGDLRPQEQASLLIDTIVPLDQVVSHARVLRRAIGVLLRNAFDASPPNAKVTLFFVRDQGRMIFQVQDGGAGMSETVLRHAGEPFFTTKPPGEGMGLGLFLVRLVAETYGGKFELQSSPHQGTRSILELCEAPEDEGTDELRQHGRESDDASGGRRRDLPQTAGPGALQPRV